VSRKLGRASIKGIYPGNIGLSVSQIVLSAGRIIYVNENIIPLVQLTLEIRYVTLCRATDIVTVPSFRRLHCPKEHRPKGRPGGYRRHEPFQLRPREVRLELAVGVQNSESKPCNVGPTFHLGNLEAQHVAR